MASSSLSASSRLISAGGGWPSLRRTVPAGVPSDLLLNRPDIDAAYRRIRAADSRVRVAHADLFPSFALTASGSQSGSVLGDLARSGFSSWSVLAGLSAPLFEGGARRAELGAAGKRADLIAVGGNPLDNIAVMEDVHFVMKQGEIHKRSP